jgi:hypothetical protein
LSASWWQERPEEILDPDEAIHIAVSPMPMIKIVAKSVMTRTEPSSRSAATVFIS